MYGIDQSVIDRVISRRGKLHCFDSYQASRCALVVIDLQNYFMAPGHMAAVVSAPAIVDTVNQAAKAMRAAGGTVIWVVTDADNADKQWPSLHSHMLTPHSSARRLADLGKGSEGYKLWPTLQVEPEDLHVVKLRYSAFIQGSSNLEQLLRERNIDTIMIAGTATNVCCESTARDGMMLNFHCVMLADANAAADDATQSASLANCLLFFGDVMNVSEMTQRLR
jgi:nicotinamidase-related amidase